MCRLPELAGQPVSRKGAAVRTYHGGAESRTG